jgi:adenine-specific DNA-methyltransferase
MAAVLAPASRYSDVEQKKAQGSTFTPTSFANFLASQMISISNLAGTSKIRILDPACGDGELLLSLLHFLPKEYLSQIDVVGFDTDAHAIRIAENRLHEAFPKINLLLEQQDFLEYVLSLDNSGDLFSTVGSQNKFQFVIANPPYVRTQILGGEQAQVLAKRFGLTGRVDLYYPFLFGISQVLASDGIMGVITSNRFMTTKSGQAVRRELLSRFQLEQVWDLGDTKLFDAAVLPSVMIGRSCDQHKTLTKEIAFSSIYETKEPALIEVADVFLALNSKDETVVGLTDGKRYKIRHGMLDNGGFADGVWRIATKNTDKWLATVEANTWNSFRRIGKIKVGVKSTADKVFIRGDWDQLKDGRPELLRPLITRKWARRYKGQKPFKAESVKEILYPHEVRDGKRSAIDLNLYPIALKYLEGFRHILESRTYLIEAGRNWYEMWVPQDPDAWAAPKLVFPDISEKPIFWLDTDGGVVNGECYWLQAQNNSEQDLLWLALAVANSSFIEVFYDHKFNNKLYAGRRRFITQYVEQFPLPDPALTESAAIVRLVKEIHANTPCDDSDSRCAELNNLVWRVFGVNVEKTSRNSQLNLPVKRLALEQTES